MIVSTEEAKEYLRIDATDEETSVNTLLQSAQNLCMDVARISDESEFEAAGTVAKTAVLYTAGYFYEHREDANHHDLTLKLRSLLFGIRKAAF